MVPNSCSFADCHKPLRHKGSILCVGHQIQRQKGEELRPIRIKHSNISDLIHAHADKSGECWEWLRGRCAEGYGRQRWEGVAWKAHRLSYVNSYGPIPTGMQIDHMCHNTGCVNPDHLRLATPKQNQENRGATKAASGYRGVVKERLGPNWRAEVRHNGIKHARYGFPTAKAADVAAREMRLALFTYNLKDQIQAKGTE